MKHTLLLFLVLTTFMLEAQTETYDFEQVEPAYRTEEVVEEYPSIHSDTLNYTKTLNYEVQRNFKDDLKDKYSGKDFEYIDNLKKEEAKPKKEKEVSDSKVADLFVNFMINIFPYLLGVLVVFILISSFVNTKSAFWKFGKTAKKEKEKLIYEDDDNIDEHDYDALLKRAVKNKEYRLATRYYYLGLLKKLSQKELISYHKDKTNTEYMFELKNEQIRSKFSYLAYIYDYVWYGEFPVDESKFATIETNYKSFLKSID